MSAILYHEAVPTNDNQNGFKEFNQIDFSIFSQGRKYLKNSMTLEADISVKLAGADLALTNDIKIDNRVGFHAVIESVSTSAKGQQVELLQDYPRYVASLMSATKDVNDCFTLADQAEGRQATEDAGKYVVQLERQRRTTAGGAAGVLTRPAKFSIKPSFALNRMVGDDYSFEKNGEIKVQVNLARNNRVLFGLSGDGTQAYTLTNVRLRYITVPDDGSQGVMMMNSVVSVKSAINSAQATISARVPASRCNGVILNFIEQANDNSNTANSYRLEQFNGLESVEYLFNDSTNKYITYRLENRDEIIRRGLEALADQPYDGGHNLVSHSKLSVNQGFLAGLSFTEYIDLSSQKFTVMLNSNITVNSALVAHLHFFNLLQL